MSSYIPHFTQAGFNQVSDLTGLMDSDLQGIGISRIGHRNKMLRHNSYVVDYWSVKENTLETLPVFSSLDMTQNSMQIRKVWQLLSKTPVPCGSHAW